MEQTVPRRPFTPKIVAFVCNWCSSASGDLVGAIRTPYRGVARVLRTLCTGRVMADDILNAMEMGADGILIAGCAPLECNYRSGNLIARRRVSFAKMLLKNAGFSPDRVEISLGFLQLVSEPLDEFRKKIIKMGPLGNAANENMTPEQIRDRLATARRVTQDPEIGWLVGKEAYLTEVGNTYGDMLSQEDFDKMIIKAIEHKYKMYHVLSKVEKVPMTIPQIAKEINMEEPEVFQLVQTLEHSGMISEAGLSGRYFQYIQA